MPETLTAPAPATTPAPSPAPTSTASPSPSPSQSVTPSQDGSDSETHSAVLKQFKAAFKDDDADDTASPDPAPEPKTDKPKPVAQAKPDPKAPVTTDKNAEKKPGGPKELREQYEATKAELEAKSKAISDLERKIAEAEAKGKDSDALKARLEQRDKEYENLQAELRAAKHEVTPEFKEKYDKPFNRLTTQVERFVKSLTLADGETPADFNKHFAPLYHIAQDSNIVSAALRAKEVFGEEAAPHVIAYVKELQNLADIRAEAYNEEKTQWAERQKSEEGRKVQEREQQKALWTKVNDDLAKSVEDYRDPIEPDKDISDARAKGISLFDYQTKSFQEDAVKHAHIRHRMGAYEVQQLLINRQKAEIAELRSKLEGTKTRQPLEDGGRKPGGTPQEAPEESPWGGLTDALRKAR